MPCKFNELDVGQTVLIRGSLQDSEYYGRYSPEMCVYANDIGTVRSLGDSKFDDIPVKVEFSDGETFWFNPEDITVVKFAPPTTISTAVVSDGGSSSYYQKEIPKHMLDRWNQTGVIEAKDVMRLFLNNDFNMSNVFKAHCRVIDLRNGRGKSGADEKYDLKKAVFFAEDELQDYLGKNSD